MKKDFLKSAFDNLIPEKQEQQTVTNARQMAEDILNNTEPPETFRIKSPRGSTTRICYNLNKDVVKKIKIIAHHERKNINELYNEALQNYIDRWTPTTADAPIK